MWAEDSSVTHYQTRFGLETIATNAGVHCAGISRISSMTVGFWDVTRRVSNALPNWPGDTPVSYQVTASIASGSSVNVGAISMSTHTGTHVDAPWHYDDAAVKLDAVPLEVYVGPCVVVDARGHDLLESGLLADMDLTGISRVIFKTGQPDVWPEFPRQYAVVDPSLPAFLTERGVHLLGTDAPSVDPLESKDLLAHHTLGRAGVHILEGLALEQVNPGRYRLVCLPLRLMNADGAPARVILEPLRTA